MFADEKRGGRDHPRSCLNGFGEVIRDCELVDLGFVGEKYTWEKPRGKANWVQERLDRGLATQQWRNLFHLAEVRVLEVATSDHLPLYLQLNKQVYVPRRKRFQFENIWIKEKDCFNLVKDSWEHTAGKPILEKMSYCALRLEEWGGGISHEFNQQLLECRKNLRKFRAHRDVPGIQTYNAVRWEYLNLLERKEVYWKQRAKQMWLQHGDQNTKFYHQFASARKTNNGFKRIKDTGGEWKETEEEIQGVITNYYAEVFQTLGLNGKLSDRETVNQVTEDENANLVAEITYEEVRSAVFSMHPDKSPGQDGLNPAFFQTYWCIVGTDVVQFCQHFLSTGELPSGINQTLVCLIPKVKEPQAMTDLRPISLCNVLVRILSKVMANRLKPCLKLLISDKQSAFIEGRLLNDNALIAFEVNHYMKRLSQGTKGIAGFKIDISKAYDRLEWEFIRNMMIKFGFTDLWIERIMGLINSVSYSFIRNGNVFGEVIPSRGVRQGDPISPYIYIMCAEGLSSIIRRNEEVGLLHGCKIARGAPTISHLLFADDCYFFFRATKTEANIMKRILGRYESISGQMINYTKSSVNFSSNTIGRDRRDACQQLGVNEVQNPGKYLGMPMCVGRRKAATFSFLSDKINQKLQLWQNQTLSKAGKVTLLKTAAQVVPNFWMSMLLIPLEVSDRIEKSMNAFWWGSGNSGRGIKWISWERLCTVKEDGGLGFKRLREFNVAMLAKQAWRVINNANPLLTDLLRARYFPNSNFLDAKLGSSPSYVWRSLMEAQGVIRQGYRRRIGDGKDTKIWKVPWLPCSLNGYLTTDIPEELQDITVENLMDESKRAWDDDVLQNICNARDCELIKKIPIPRIRKNDSWFWYFDEKGEFSVKSCYRHIRGERECLEKVFWKKLWGLKLPGKVTNLLWRTCRGVLPTAVALARKHVEVSTVCSWCQRAAEDDMHILFQCCFARDLWDKVGLAELVTVSPSDTVMTILKRVFQNGGHQRNGLVGMLCWNLWYRRNNWVWNRINTSSFGVKSRTVNMLAEWNRAREDMQKQTARTQASNRIWSKPPEGWVKINVDAACMLRTGQMGVGCVIRDECGRFMRARSQVVQGCLQPREVEAIGLREALSWTKNWRRSKCIFECDAKALVEAVNGEGGQSYFHTIVDDCKDIIKHFDEVLVTFVPRSANMVAHLLAKATYSMSGLQEWVSTAPDFIICNIASEEG
ncbi:uncharacterized protein LOC141695374 [Apium graveolens]|uniref:uncharacterized protein LOC141695374 n=1 Tax=Apium graveolens TaxID=4045 RepID=UPI003D7ACD72